MIADIPKFINNEENNFNKPANHFELVLNHVFKYISEKTGLDITR